MSQDSGDAPDPLADALHEWESAQTASGPRHESTLAALLVLASARRSSGDGAGAIRDAREVRDGRRDVLGAEHPDTLAAAWLVTAWRHELGETGTVEELGELVPVMTRVLGAEHPDTHGHATLLPWPPTPPRIPLAGWCSGCNCAPQRRGCSASATN